MGRDWLDVLDEAEADYYFNQDVNAVANVLHDLALQQIHEKQVWRINNLLKAALNEKKGKPGELGRNQGQIRAVGEGLHAETFRRLRGKLEGIDALLAMAEKSREDRERWFETALTPMLRKQLEILGKMVA